MSGTVLVSPGDLFAPLLVAEAFNRTQGPYERILYLLSRRRKGGAEGKEVDQYYLEGLS